MSGAIEQDKWKSMTPEDLLKEAQALTEQFKATHDDSLVPRIQALRQAAHERRKATTAEMQGEPSKFCVKCGKRLPPESTYCSSCGVTQVELAKAPPVNRPVSFRSWVVALAVLAAVVLCGFIGKSILTHRDRKLPTVSAPPPASPADKWRVTEGRSPMDDSKEVYVMLDAENQIEGPLGMLTPSLIVRCKEKKTDVYVVTGMAASIEEDYDGGPKDSHTARIRLDDNPPQQGEWGESTDHKALFAEDWVSGLGAEVVSTSRTDFAKKIASANTLTFEFTPFDSSPQVARFDVRGLSVHLPKVAEACGWTYE
ncbi:MAG: zinc-ribbon domain-containing protein [Terriglobia bacterium]|jgi:type VI secretion system protein VasI